MNKLKLKDANEYPTSEVLTNTLEESYIALERLETEFSIFGH